MGEVASRGCWCSGRGPRGSRGGGRVGSALAGEFSTDRRSADASLTSDRFAAFMLSVDSSERSIESLTVGLPVIVGEALHHLLLGLDDEFAGASIGPNGLGDDPRRYLGIDG
jgi:hypothetical protein